MSKESIRIETLISRCWYGSPVTEGDMGKPVTQIPWLDEDISDYPECYPEDIKEYSLTGARAVQVDEDEYEISMKLCRG